MIVTVKFELPDSAASDLQEMKRDGALNDLAECLATWTGRRVIGVEFGEGTVPEK